MKENSTKKGGKFKYFLNNLRSSKFKYFLSILFLACLIVVTCILLFTKYDFKELMKVIGDTQLRFVFIGVAMIFVYIYFEGLAMRYIFKAMDLNVSRRSNFMYSAIDYYFCAITPSATGGQPMVAYYMAKDKLPLTNVSLTLLINTAFFKIVLIFYSLLCLIFCYNFIFDYPLMIVLYFLGLGFNLLIIVLLFMVSFKPSIVEKIGNKLIVFGHKIHIIKNPDKYIEKYSLKMEEYRAAIVLIKSRKKEFMLSLLCNFIQRLAFFSIAYFVYLAFSKAFPDIEGFNFMDLFAIQVFIALCVDSLPLPGGVGISEYLYLLLYGIIYSSESRIPSAMLLTRAVNFYVPLIVTGILVVIKQIINIIRFRRDN